MTLGFSLDTTGELAQILRSGVGVTLRDRIENFLAGIGDPVLRDMFRRRLYGAITQFPLLESAPLSPNRDFQASVRWFDPFLGTRIAIELYPGVDFMLRADIGGTRTSGTNIMWQVMTGITYRWSDDMRIQALYRNLHFNYKREDGFVFNGSLEGPEFRLLWKF